MVCLNYERNVIAGSNRSIVFCGEIYEIKNFIKWFYKKIGCLDKSIHETLQYFSTVDKIITTQKDLRKANTARRR